MTQKNFEEDGSGLIISSVETVKTSPASHYDGALEEDDEDGSRQPGIGQQRMNYNGQASHGAPLRD